MDDPFDFFCRHSPERSSYRRRPSSPPSSCRGPTAKLTLQPTNRNQGFLMRRWCPHIEWRQLRFGHIYATYNETSTRFAKVFIKLISQMVFNFHCHVKSQIQKWLVTVRTLTVKINSCNTLGIQISFTKTPDLLSSGVPGDSRKMMPSWKASEKKKNRLKPMHRPLFNNITISAGYKTFWTSLMISFYKPFSWLKKIKS